MRATRIVSASAGLSAILGLVASAAAQTATSGSAGAPLPLLNFVRHTSTQTVHPHARPVKLAERPAKVAAKRPAKVEAKRTAKVEAKRTAKVAAKQPEKVAAERRRPVEQVARARKPVLEARHRVPAHAAVPAAPAAAVATVPQSMWPAVDAAAPADAHTGTLAAQASPAAAPSLQASGQALGQAPGKVSTVAVVDASPNEILAGNHTVDGTDLSGGSSPIAPAKAQQASAPPVQAAAPAPDRSGGPAVGVTRTAANIPASAFAAPPPVPAAEPAVAAAQPAAPAPAPVATKTASAVAAPVPAAHALVSATAQPRSPVGSASWIAHLLAALGGALTAGVVAWFLIRPTPERTYG